MAPLTYLQAISSALRDELRSDDRVLMMGEDIGVFGGAFKVTDGFIEEFGADRVMDTPLAESGIIGTAIWRRTSSAASPPRASCRSTWAGRRGSRAGATATCTSATATSAASEWSRCSPT